MGSSLQPTAAEFGGCIGSPFHAGERRVQQHVGVRDRIEQVGRKVIRDYMPEQHREFFGELPLLLIGSLDNDGRPWASILAGAPGFITTPDARTLAVGACPPSWQPWSANLKLGAPVGLLGIQPETRRRNRVNGRLTALNGLGFSVRVEQSFGNCPKYIQARKPVAFRSSERPRAARPEGAVLSMDARDLIARADTFFMATASGRATMGGPGEGVDVSHRGGPTGFVGVEERNGRTLLLVPDFIGNFLFNSIGNLLVNPWAGLLFLDFARGDLLSLIGTVEVEWDGPELSRYRGAQRLLRIQVEEGMWLEGGMMLRWLEGESSRHVAGFGPWTELETPLP
jgi:predicted pyridoxine 5'-phosphate oxidase superfamily flavin-nucleotide-binding protein